MKLELLEDLYTQELAALHDAEKQIIGISPAIIEAISTEETRQVFNQHLETTKGQARRLEQILARRGPEGLKKQSQAMAGLLADSQELLKQGTDDRALLESGLILAAKKVEALEIACYSGAVEFARQLGFHEDFELLEQTLREEQKMAESLTGIAASLTLETAENETVLPAGTRH